MSTILITGTTDGLGRALAGKLSAEGHTLLLHGRDAAKLADVAAELPGQSRTYVADLASLEQVRALADELLANEPRIDTFVSNAGVGFGEDVRELSADGLELRFAVNYLAGFLLTRLLLPRLKEHTPARIVLVASIGQKAIDFDDVMLDESYVGVDAYRQSKLAQIADAITLSEQLDSSEVLVASLHPATLMPTKMGLQTGRTVDSLQRGLEATHRVVTADDVEHGAFYDRERIGDPDPWALDPANRARLLELSQQLTGL